MIEDLENKILMRATGELTSKEKAALAETISKDSEAAAYADFLEGTLAGAAEAPRDFVAEGIKLAHFRFKPIHLIFPAAVAAAIAIFLHLRRDTTPPAGTERFTASISNRIDRIESEIPTAREGLTRSRYHRP